MERARMEALLRSRKTEDRLKGLDLIRTQADSSWGPALNSAVLALGIMRTTEADAALLTLSEESPRESVRIAVVEALGITMRDSEAMC